MTRSIARLAFVALLLAGCTGGGTTASPALAGSPDPTTPGRTSSAPATSAATPTAIPANVPAGRILFHRQGADEVEHYFTINTDGTDERPLFTAEGCACARWSTDGTRVWTMGETGHGTWSFTTMRPDGSDRVVVSPAIETLNLGPGAPSVDGRWIAFDGWDETDPSRNGLYLGSPDLADLRLVRRLPEGTVHVDPFGVTPDGSHVLFMSERADKPHIEGDLYVVDSDGRGLRRLNPPDTTLNFEAMPASLSPDGRQAAFGVDDAVFIVDLDGSEARSITNRAGFVWAVSWSPTGEWITFSRKHGSTFVVSLVRPDGSDQKEISANHGSDQAEVGVWSPDGKYLLVQRGAGGANDLWIMDLDGTFIGQVTHEPSSYGTYSWAPASGSCTLSTGGMLRLNHVYRAILGRFDSAPVDRFVRGFRVSRVRSEACGPQRRSEAGNPTKRTSDKCACLYWASTLVALRIGAETYETAALPLSYVGADQE